MKYLQKLKADREALSGLLAEAKGKAKEELEQKIAALDKDIAEVEASLLESSEEMKAAQKEVDELEKKAAALRSAKPDPGARIPDVKHYQDRVIDYMKQQPVVNVALPLMDGELPEETVIINDVKWVIPRGQTVSVPQPVFDILNAKFTAERKMKQVSDEQMKKMGTAGVITPEKM